MAHELQQSLRMSRSRNFDTAAFAVAVALTRFIFRSREPYDLDSVNFALGIARFDPRVHQPHPPGYFLYVCCGRLLDRFVHDPNLALVLLSIAASCGAVVFIYRLALRWSGQLAARFAALLFLLSPLTWFHGIVALTYGVEAFFSALIGYLCWLIFRGDHRWIPVTGLVLGISAGVRPSSVLLLGPLFLLALYRTPIRSKVTRSCCSGTRGRGMVSADAFGKWRAPRLLLRSGFPVALSAVENHDLQFVASQFDSARHDDRLHLPADLRGGFSGSGYRPEKHSGEVPRIPVQRRLDRTSPMRFHLYLIYLKFVNSGYVLLLAPAGCV